MIDPDELDALRATAQDWMSDTCTILRPNTAGTVNVTALQWVPGTATTLYTGPCMLSFIPFRPEVSEFGEQQVTRKRAQLHVPARVDNVAVGDIARLTVCSADPSLVGRSLHILDVPRGTLLVNRVFLVEDVTDD